MHYEIRYHDGLVWSVDRFQDANAGLVLAEVETDDPDRPIDLPPLVGAEVTLYRHFGNSHLARWPVSTRSRLARAT
jgi:adenylate cyclase